MKVSVCFVFVALAVTVYSAPTGAPAATKAAESAAPAAKKASGAAAPQTTAAPKAAARASGAPATGAPAGTTPKKEAILLAVCSTVLVKNHAKRAP